MKTKEQRREYLVKTLSNLPKEFLFDRDEIVSEIREIDLFPLRYHRDRVNHLRKCAKYFDRRSFLKAVKVAEKELEYHNNCIKSINN